MKRRRWIAIGGGLILLIVLAFTYAARRQHALGEFQFLAPYIVKDTTDYSRGTIVFRPGPLKPDAFVATRTFDLDSHASKEIFELMETHFTRANGYVLVELPASDVDDPELMIEPYHSRPFGPAEPGLQQISGC